MPAQDDARENRLVDLFNLDRPENRVRHGVDAVLRIDDREYEFELKSITTVRGGLTTVRDFGPDHIEKWRKKHWIVAIYRGDQLTACKYASPDDLKPWIEDRWNYIKADFMAAEVVPQRVSMESMFDIIGRKKVITWPTPGCYRNYSTTPTGTRLKWIFSTGIRQRQCFGFFETGLNIFFRGAPH